GPRAGPPPRGLVGGGVAEHALLAVPTQPYQPPVAGHGEQVVQEAGRTAQLLDGLQQRRETQVGERPVAGPQVDQAGLPGQDDGGQDVVGTLGHRDDVGLDDVRAVGLPGPADLLEDGQGAVPRCGRPEQRPAGGQLAHEDVLAPGPVQARVGDVQLADVVQETADGGVVGVGVLADVEGGEVQPGTGGRL